MSKKLNWMVEVTISDREEARESQKHEVSGMRDEGARVGGERWGRVSIIPDECDDWANDSEHHVRKLCNTLSDGKLSWRTAWSWPSVGQPSSSWLKVNNKLNESLNTQTKHRIHTQDSNHNSLIHLFVPATHYFYPFILFSLIEVVSNVPPTSDRPWVGSFSSLNILHGCLACRHLINLAWLGC